MVLAMCLVGCKREVPDLSKANAGIVATHSRLGLVDNVTNSTLSPLQVKALSDWVSSHRTNWYWKFEDTAPGTLVFLEHDGVAVTAVNIREQFVCVGDTYRDLTPSEWAELQKIIHGQNG